MVERLFKKGLVFGIVVLFVGMSIVPSSANINKINSVTKDESTLTPLTSGNTLYVGGSGEGNYSRIQDAIDNASNGDTVFVFDDSSPYYENVNILRSIDLIGEDKNTTIIDGQNKTGFDTVLIARHNVTISGFTIQHCGTLAADGGIDIFEKNYCTIKII